MSEALNALLDKVPELRALLKPDPRDSVTVRQVIDAYLADAGTETETMQERARALLRFAAAHADLVIDQCNPLTLKTWIKRNRRWASSWTAKRINGTVQRAFNWAADMRLIRGNPFKGLRYQAGERKRPMTDGEFRQALRACDACMRRVLLFLKLTGCRPGELAAIKWENVDWDRRVVVLNRHKTSKKTRKPRIIALPPVALKLLAWIKRHPIRQASTALMRVLLAQGPRPVQEVILALKQAGLSHFAQYRARKRLGVRLERRRLPSGRMNTFYVMPATNAKLETEPPEEHVFTNGCGRHWERHALSTRFKALRERCDLPADCFLYGLRHRYGSQAILHGVGIKTVAELLGHADCRMSEHYVHISGDTTHLVDAASKVK